MAFTTWALTALLQMPALDGKRLGRSQIQEMMNKLKPDALFDSPLRDIQDAQLLAVKTLSSMTEEEKHRLLVGSHFIEASTNINDMDSGSNPESGYYTGYTEPVKRLGVPPLKMSDAGNGFRPTLNGTQGTSTCWPSLLSIGASWDEALAGRVAKEMTKEFKGKGANQLLGPSVNVHRIAKGGRNFEYLSGEDPYLGARLAPAIVRGIQGEGVIATVKHWAFNEQETQRGSEMSIASDRTAWNIYYPPFQAAIDAGAMSVMCAYNRVGLNYACHDSKLLRTDLKDRMGFKGFVVSDWGGVHGSDALAAGTDVEMPGTTHTPNGTLSTPADFSEAALNDKSNEWYVQEAALRVLTAIYRLRLDECGEDQAECCIPPNCTQELWSDQTSQAHRDLAREAATSGAVLVKNEGLLPLSSSTTGKLAIVGHAADTIDYYSGGGSGTVPIRIPITTREAITTRAIARGIEVVVDAKDADVVVVVAGASSREGKDRSSLNLDKGDDELIRTMAGIRPTVVITHIPGTILMPWHEDVEAILCLFAAGEEAGTASAEILFGDASPDGRLPVMIPASEADTIQAGKDGYVVYSEGMKNSYRNPDFKAIFPFGHGLSYGRFLYDDAHALKSGQSWCPQETAMCIEVTVTNVGDLPGKDVVQAYVQFPEISGMPPRLLRNFHKTKTLLPGESENVILVFSHLDLSTYMGQEVGNTFWKDAKIHVGRSSENTVSVLDLSSNPWTMLDF